MKNRVFIGLPGLAGHVAVAGTRMASPILPAIANSLGTDIPSAGLLIAAHLLPLGLFQLVSGPLDGAVMAQWGLHDLFYALGTALPVTWVLSFGLIRSSIIEADGVAVEAAE